MALTGQLSDMSLAEWIEFFCNQRKTGRLKVDYQRGHGVFFIKNGELVDAKVGALSGVEAVYFALTLPNAAFDFIADFEPPRRTIHQSWKQVVLEGLHRLDEGHLPNEADAFSGNEQLNSADAETPPHATKANGESLPNTASIESDGAYTTAVPLSQMVEGANRGGARKNSMIVGAVVACVVLVCAVAAIPLSSRFRGGKDSTASSSAVTSSAPTSSSNNSSNPNESSASSVPEASPTEAPPADSAASVEAIAVSATLAARREREDRESAARAARARKAEVLANNTESSPKASATPASAGPKSVRVSVAYDEGGRVTQASIAGSSPGAEAYAGTAVRIARGRRFPAGKAGSTIVTIPIN